MEGPTESRHTWLTLLIPSAYTEEYSFIILVDVNVKDFLEHRTLERARVYSLYFLLSVVGFALAILLGLL